MSLVLVRKLTETVDHRHRDLIAALLTIGQCRAGEIERNLRTERLEGDKRILRASGRREQQDGCQRRNSNSDDHSFPP
jgi:hypothetical protein